MPLRDPRDFFATTGTAFQAMTARGQTPAPPETGFWGTLFDRDLWQSAMEIENPIVSMAVSHHFHELERNQERDTSYNVFRDEDLTAYRGFEGQFADVKNRQHFLIRKSRLDMEIEARNKITESGWAGFAAAVGSGMMSPENILPVGAGVQAGKASLLIGKSIARGARAGAVGGAVGASVAEAALQGSQLTRTELETAAGVLGGTVLGGLLGGVGGAGGAIMRQHRLSVGHELLRDGGIGESVGAAIRRQHSLSEEKTLWDFLQEHPENLNEIFQNAIKEVDPEMAKVAFTTNPHLNKLFNKGIRFTPWGRLATSESTTASLAGRAAADDNGIARGMDSPDVANFGASAESATEMWYMKAAVARSDVRTIYNKASMGNMDPMDYVDFKTAMAREMRGYGNKSDLTDSQRGAVEDASAQLRKLFDSLRDEAKKVGLLSGIDLRGTAENYLTRGYDIEKILEDPEAFERFLVGKHQFTLDAAKKARQHITDGSGFHNSQDFHKLENGATEPFTVKDRQVRISDEDLDGGGWLINDVEILVERATKAMAGEIELARRFRPGESIGVTQLFDEFETKISGWRENADPLDVQLFAERVQYLESVAAHGRAGGERAKAIRLEELIPERERLFRERDALRKEVESFNKEIEQLSELNKRISILEEQIKVREMGISRNSTKTLSKTKRKVHNREIDKQTNARQALRKAEADKASLEKSTSARADTPARLTETEAAFKRTHDEAEALRVDNDKAVNLREVGSLKNQRGRNAELDKIEGRVAALRRRQAKAGYDMSEILHRVDQEYDDLLSETGISKSRKLQLIRLRDRDIKDIKLISNRILGNHTIGGDAHNIMFQAEAFTRKLNFVRMLGGMAISSIPDIAMPIFVNGFRPWAVSIIPAMKEVFSPEFRGSIREIRQGSGTTSTLRGWTHRDELYHFIVAGETMTNARAHSIGHVLDEPSNTAFGRFFDDKVVEPFGRATLIHRWNGFMKGVAAHASVNRVYRDLKLRKAGGRAAAAANRRLKQFKISDDLADRLDAQFAKHGETESVFGISSIWARTQNWDDQATKQTFQELIVEATRRTILTPGVGDLPEMADRPFLRMLIQFKSFTFAATNKILLAGLHRRDAMVLNGLMSSVTMGMMTYALKETLAGRELSDNPQEWIRNGVDRSGVMGWVMELDAITRRVTNGDAALVPFMGSEVTSRFKGRNAVDALLGPSIGTLSDMVDIGGAPFSEQGFDNHEIRRMRKMMPYQNLFYIRWLFNQLEDGVNETLGNEPRRNRAESVLR